MIAVVAGVVRRGGRVLLCQRPEGKRLGLLWEFPGGKLEAGECPEAALERELREELAIETRTGRVLDALRLDARGGGAVPAGREKAAPALGGSALFLLFLRGGRLRGVLGEVDFLVGVFLLHGHAAQLDHFQQRHEHGDQLGAGHVLVKQLGEGERAAIQAALYARHAAGNGEAVAPYLADMVAELPLAHAEKFGKLFRADRVLSPDVLFQLVIDHLSCGCHFSSPPSIFSIVSR